MAVGRGGGFTEEEILQKVYPVGSIYISTISTNPSDLFGFGSWEQICGRFLIGTGPIDSNTTDYFGTIKTAINVPTGEKGGEDFHTLIWGEMPAHDHYTRVYNQNNQDFTSRLSGTGYFSHINWSDGTIKTAGSDGGDLCGITTGAGNGWQHNNMPPYLAVYIWKRTA